MTMGHRLSKILILASALGLFSLGPSLAAAPVTDCDNLAAHPADPNKVAEGVQWDLIDARRAMKACRSAVSRYPDSARMKFQLGRVLVFAKQRDEGLSYLFEAASQNYLIAYSLIGGTYQYDIGNLTEALNWYKRGTALGDVSAQTHLAEMYLHGVGVEKNLQTALNLFKPSAEAGYPLSSYKLGVIYRNGGKTVRRDVRQAIAWMERAAKQGFARAQNDLGHIYETGDGVPRNPIKALSWYRLAADQGWSLAQVNLGRVYERGIGISRDRKEAFYWYRLASSARASDIQQDARAGVNRLRNRIQTAELQEVDRRINSWRSLSAEESAASTELAALVDPTYTPPQTTQTASSTTAGTGADPAYVPPASNTATNSGASTSAGTTTTVDNSYVPPAPTTTTQTTTTQTAAIQQNSGQQNSGQQTATQGTSAGAAMPSISPRYGRYMAKSNVNVRAAPNRSGQVIATLRKGEDVISLGQVIGSDWLMVNLASGAMGYVASDFVVALDGTATTGTTAVAQAGTDQTQQATTEAGFNSVEFGSYYALVIGNNNYQSLPKLDTAVNDALRVSEVLRDFYNFNVQTLINATRADIVVALDHLRTKLKKEDNLLIYYGGHGILDVSAERGYWLPVDATTDTQVSWVSNATITDTIKAMEANHVMLVVDSCYSGTLTRSIGSTLQSPSYYQKMISKRARVALTSGGLEPVMDGGGGGHSVFAKAFIDALLSNQGLMDGSELFQKVRRPVVLNASQTPEFSDVRFAGHDGGDFIFLRRSL